MGAAEGGGKQFGGFEEFWRGVLWVRLSSVVLNGNICTAEGTLEVSIGYFKSIASVPNSKSSGRRYVIKVGADGRDALMQGTEGRG